MVEVIKNKKRRGRFYAYAPLFLWICLIFFLSSTLGSSSHTSRIVRPLLEWLFPAAAPETITLYHAYVRKFAHFTEYAVLAFWSWRAFKGKKTRAGKDALNDANNTFPRGRVSAFERFVEKYAYPAALGVVVLVASLDEFGQSFNPARTGSPYDVLLDISGGLTMILFLRLFTKKQAATTDF